MASHSKSGRGVATVPIFLLVLQVQMRKRLDLAWDADAAQGALAGLIVVIWVETTIDRLSIAAAAIYAKQTDRDAHAEAVGARLPE